MKLIAPFVLIVSLAGSPVWAWDLSSVLRNSDTPAQFKVIHVNDLIHLRASQKARVIVLDANYAAIRDQEGVIPGAVMLSSESNYNVATELPHDKTAKLIFYCYNKA
jgi:hypothetical protein